MVVEIGVTIIVAIVRVLLVVEIDAEREGGGIDLQLRSHTGCLYHNLHTKKDCQLHAETARDSWSCLGNCAGTLGGAAGAAGTMT